MKKKMSDDLFNDEPIAGSKDFASLFEESLNQTTRRLNVGDKLRGEILTIGKTEAFVSTGTPLDAVILTNDLINEKQEMAYKVGDVIEIVILRVTSDEVRATRKGSKSAPVDFENLEDAFDMELPVEGKITEVVNGGFRVSIQGQSAFCPISQLEGKQITDPSALIGKKYEFLITQFEPKRRNIVVSRRKLLDLQRAENEGTWLQTNKVGDILTGTVTRAENYGAFVELTPGVEGLVHVSEIGYVRLKHAADGVHIGESVQVKILKIEDVEDSRLKISLSIKQAGGIADPWIQIPQKYPVGTIFNGVVDNKESFGIFVNILPGINGLLPKSKWRDAGEAKIYESAKRGDSIKVRIDEIKFEDRKIALGLPTEGEDESWREHVTKSSAFGALSAAFKQAGVKKN
jgi:small subunit ribosomal protein S1